MNKSACSPPIAGEPRRWIFATANQRANCQVGSIQPEYVLASDYDTLRAQLVEAKKDAAQWRQAAARGASQLSAASSQLADMKALNERLKSEVIQGEDRETDLSVRLANMNRDWQETCMEADTLRQHLRVAEGLLADMKERAGKLRELVEYSLEKMRQHKMAYVVATVQNTLDALSTTPSPEGRKDGADIYREFSKPIKLADGTVIP